MFSAFFNAFKIPELRQRILFTLIAIFVVRIGAAIPCPGVNTQVLGEFFSHVIDQQQQGSVVGLFNLFSGGAVENCALFSLGVMPYISASIMMQLLTAIVPSLSKLVREEGGRQKVTQYSRVLTLVICLVQGYLFALSFEGSTHTGLLAGIDAIIAKLGIPLVPNPGLGFELLTVISLTTGTMILMWVGEQITDKGIGNGVSIVITVGILARFPNALVQGYDKLLAPGSSTAVSPLLVVLLLAFLFGVIAATVAMTQAVRKVIVQYAKQVRGNKVYGGQSSFLPLKVNYAGVMPIIFANAIVLFPATILILIFPKIAWIREFGTNLSSGWLHYLITGLMILFFSYFWVATQFNPVQIADDLKKHGGFIPGIRPGQATSDFLDHAMTRLTLAGAVFLTLLAILPMFIQEFLLIPVSTSQFFGGTSLLILVGVVLDTMRQTETYLLQRHYDGFLKKGRIRGRSTTGVGSQGRPLDNDALIWLYVGLAALAIAAISISLFYK